MENIFKWWEWRKSANLEKENAQPNLMSIFFLQKGILCYLFTSLYWLYCQKPLGIKTKGKKAKKWSNIVSFRIDGFISEKSLPMCHKKLMIFKQIFNSKNGSTVSCPGHRQCAALMSSERFLILREDKDCGDHFTESDESKNLVR